MSKSKFSAEQVGNDAPLVVGGVLGAMVGRGLTSVIAKNAATTDTKKTLVNAVMAVGGLLLYSYVGSDSNLKEGMQLNAIKGAGLGIAIDNTLQLVSGFANKSDAIKAKLVADTATNRFLKGSLALNCPDGYPTMMRTIPAMARPRKGVRMPEQLRELTFDEMINAKKDLLSA